MLINYLKIAMRNLTRYKIFSFINIIGLTAGMTCCFLILLFVSHELSYDSFHEHADRIYRVKYTPLFVGTDLEYARIPPPISPLLPEYFPEIEYSARVYQRSASISVERSVDGISDIHNYEEERFFFADSTIFNILTFEFISGNPSSALNEPFTVIITESTAEKYFGDTFALGNTIILAGEQQFRITGIIRDFPAQSHIRPEFIASYESMFAIEPPGAKQNLLQNWVISHSTTYVLLRPGYSAAEINQRIPLFLDTHAPERFKSDIAFELEPIREIHLHSDAIFNPEPTGNIIHVYFFSVIAFLTVLIASFNFINLSTARSIRRAKEVGMRKVMGAHRSNLISQFIGESLLLSFIAFILSIFLIELLLPTFNNLTNRSLSFSALGNPSILFLYIIVFIGTGILAGSYPAFFVSSFQPITALKNAPDKQGSRGLGLRKALVVAQFTVTIALLAGTLIVNLQLHFWRSQPLGFDKEHMLVVPLFSSNINNIFSGMTPETQDRLESYKTEIMTHPYVTAMTISSHLPGVSMIIRNVIPEGFTDEDNLFIGGIAVDYNFIETYGLEILEGRNFSKDFGSDHQYAFIINEKAVEVFGWNTAGEALGKSIEREGKQGAIVGVIRDFHHRNLRMSINGYLLDVNPSLFRMVSIRINGRYLSETIEYLRDTWSEYFPEKVFDYTFLDSEIDMMYGDEDRLARLIGYFSVLAIVICSLGLYGLILLAAERRTKEIGIRKVLGASVPHILYIIAKEFTGLIIAACFIAIPITYIIMNLWLMDFAYRINIGWYIFAAAGGTVFIIGLFTISFQAVKAAHANPVESLKYE